MFRESACLILKSASQILMVKRRPKGNFGSFTVFPGGILQDSDRFFKDEEQVLKVAAIRETLEETGILVSKEIQVFDSCQRKSIKSNLMDLPLNSLFTLSTWITPPHEPIRFKTTFFLLKVENIPKSLPDGNEIVEIFTKSSKELLHDFQNGNILLMPPQWILLNILNGTIELEKFRGIIDPELVYKSKRDFTLVFPGDYQHSKSLKSINLNNFRKFRILGKVENGRTVEYNFVDEIFSKL